MDLNNVFDYKKFNDKTKLYLNKVMDIYSLIMDKIIIQKVEKFHETKYYTFTKLDKKVLSLFIAGFLVDEDIKNIYSQYDDIKLDDLLDFIDIKKNDIKELTDDKYEDFYKKNIQLDLISIIIKDSVLAISELNFLTPGIIISSLQYISLRGSDILDYFALKYETAGSFLGFNSHPIFEAFRNYILMDGSIGKRETTKRSYNNSSSLLTKFTENYDRPELDENKIISDDFDNDYVWETLESIQNKFIGQEKAVEDLFNNIINNQQLIRRDDYTDGQRSLIFLDGPTGTGKTAIIREITDKLDIPFVSTSITNYSSTGYQGGNITDNLNRLLQKANGDLEKAQGGIIVLDEFDKIAYSRKGGLEMKKAVQQQLLDFLGGGKYDIDIFNNINDIRKVEFDTSRLTFICLGALTELRKQKTENKHYIGFGNENTNKIVTYKITPQDLIDLGLEPELIGRFNTYLHTEEYTKENLINILKKSTISPMIGFEKWITSKDKKLIINQDVYEAIADAAYELNTGARSLQTIMNNVRSHFLSKVLKKKNQEIKEIKLDAKTIIEINENTFNRKVRR